MPTYDAPDGSYTSAIPPGMKAFRKVVGQHFGYARTEVIRDKPRCRQARSEHCECGACDFFTTDIPKGRSLFDWCVHEAERLGIQSVIFNRRVWGFGTWSERAYTGPSPHTDHVHVGLNRRARQHLTEQQVRDRLPVGPAPNPPAGPQEDEMKVVLVRKDGGDGKIFRLYNDRLEWVRNADTFMMLGYDWNAVVTLPPASSIWELPVSIYSGERP